MYIFEDMIELGLKEGQDFPTPAHKAVAIICGIGNPYVNTRDLLTEVVQSVISVPTDKIKVVTSKDLTDTYGMPTIF